jgi:excisionase family DNA binding protein
VLGVSVFDQEFIDAIADAVAGRIMARMGDIPTSPRRLLTVKEAAEYLGRTEDAVYQLISRRKLQAVRNGRRVHLEASELDKFVEMGRSE